MTALGVSDTVGAGIFVLTGTVAAHTAGPAVSLSYLRAGLACLCIELCDTELAATCPGAGSAYTYTYVAIGQLAAGVIGWDLLLEFLFAGATVSVRWSGYLKGLIHSFGASVPEGLTDSHWPCRRSTTWL